MSAVIPAMAHLVDVLLPTLFPGAQVDWGIPTGVEGPTRVQVNDATVSADAVVMATTRPVSEAFDIPVLISCHRTGGQTAQRTASTDAMTMLTTLRNYFKTNGNETLGGTVRRARITAYELTGDDDPEDVMTGRLAQVTATLTVTAEN